MTCREEVAWSALIMALGSATVGLWLTESTPGPLVLGAVCVGWALHGLVDVVGRVDWLWTRLTWWRWQRCWACGRRIWGVLPAAKNGGWSYLCARWDCSSTDREEREEREG